jgi:hypothetical protein
MISIANSILFQHSTTKSHDKLRDFFIQINDSLCKPDPLPETEVSRIWEDALVFVSKIKELGQQQREKSSDVVRGEDMVWIPSEVRQELAEHKWALTRHTPPGFVIAHTRFNQIVEGSTDSREIKEQSGPSLKTCFLKYAKVLSNAIPIEVITYEDPISMTFDRRYKIKFRTSAGKIFTSHGPTTLDGIFAELVDKALVYSAQEGKEALSRIVNAFENVGSIKISQEIESPGFYLIDGRIKGTQGRIACGIWESFYHGIKNYIPFTTANTEARLGRKLGQCTLPITFN